MYQARYNLLIESAQFSHQTVTKAVTAHMSGEYHAKLFWDLQGWYLAHYLGEHKIVLAFSAFQWCINGPLTFSSWLQDQK